MNTIEQIRAEIERLKSQLVRGACAAGIAMETNCKEEAYNEVLAFIDSLPIDSKIERKEFQRGYEKGFKDGALGSEIIESFSAKSKED